MKYTTALNQNHQAKYNDEWYYLLLLKNRNGKNDRFV